MYEKEYIIELLEEIIKKVDGLEGDELKVVLHRGYYKIMREVSAIKEDDSIIERLERLERMLEELKIINENNENKVSINENKVSINENKVSINENKVSINENKFNKFLQNAIKVKSGEYKPRQKVNSETVRDLYLSGIKPPTIAKMLGIATSSVYKHLKKFGLK